MKDNSSTTILFAAVHGAQCVGVNALGGIMVAAHADAVAGAYFKGDVVYPRCSVGEQRCYDAIAAVRSRQGVSMIIPSSV